MSKSEHQRLSQFPDEVTDTDCIVYFTLTPADQKLIRSRRSEENRRGIALLLCSLRYLGYFPPKIHDTPENVVAFVAKQLQVSPEYLAAYADRDETRREHVPKIMQHLGFYFGFGRGLTMVTWTSDQLFESSIQCSNCLEHRLHASSY